MFFRDVKSNVSNQTCTSQALFVLQIKTYFHLLGAIQMLMKCPLFLAPHLSAWRSFLWLSDPDEVSCFCRINWPWRGKNPRRKDEQMVEHLDGWRKGELKIVLLLTVCVCVHVWLASRCRGNSTVNLHDREKPECLCYTDTNETQSIKTIKTRVLFFLASVFAGDGFLCRSVLIISLHISDIGTGLHPWCVCVSQSLYMSGQCRKVFIVKALKWKRREWAVIDP